MTSTIEGIHWDLPDEVSETLQKKLAKLEKWDQALQSINVKVIKDSNEYVLEGIVTFSWGSNAIVKNSHHYIKESIDAFVDSLSNKIRKEIDKSHNK